MAVIEVEELLAGARVGLVVADRPSLGGELRAPRVRPARIWWDGRELWIDTAADTALHQALRAAQRAVVLAAPAAGAGEPLTVGIVGGVVRPFGLHDPLGLAVHAGTVTAARAVLQVGAGRRRVAMLRSWLSGAAVSRLRVDQARRAMLPEPAAPTTPALPTTIPAEIRRELVGIRHVLVAAPGPRATVAAWSLGLRLDAVEDPALLAEGVPVTVAGPVSDAAAYGVAIEGTVDAEQVLQPTEVAWWSPPFHHATAGA